MVKEATVTEARDELPELIQLVRAGESVVITDNGRAVARLVPAPPPSEVDWDARLDRLERAGKVTRGAAGPPDPLILAPPSRLAEPAGALAAFLEERREAR